MEENENIYDKIKELLGSLPNRLNVLEEKINLDLQIEFYEYSRRLKREIDPDQVLSGIIRLFRGDSSCEEKKTLLASLALIGKPEAYRAIEKFKITYPGKLKEWATLALQENRMLLESLILEENQVFISTGLGGKGNKLRYFVVLFGKDSVSLNELHKKIIRIEFEMCLKKYDSELEELNFSGSLANMLAIIPMNVTIKKLFSEGISECNFYGDFLMNNFIITNVKELSFDEVNEYIKNQQLFTAEG